jgi:hypothetical protein
VLALLLVAADKAPTTGTAGWLLVFTTGITALGVVGAAGVTAWNEVRKGKDNLKTYKRNIYRNFLDHAYWYRDETLSDEDRAERARLYVADWHRIWLIAPETVRSTVDGLREPGSLTDENEKPVIAAFTEDLGLRGLGETQGKS